jgi:phage protein D
VSHSFQILVGGSPVDATLYGAIETLEIEENADMPGAIQMTLPVARTADGDLTLINDAPFQPLANLAVVVTADGQDPECIFDGYVLSQKLHLDQGAVSAKVTLWGQDASWMMNLEEKVREWSDVSDGDVANSIFGDYGFETASENTDDDSPQHVEDKHTLMQRASDIQFLRTLARRSGKLCRVACGSEAGQNTGYFIKPNLDGEASITLSLQVETGSQLGPLDFEWDVTRPTTVIARAAVLDDDDQDGVDGGTDDSGLQLLSDRGLSDFAGQPMTVLLTTGADDASELQLRAASVLREAGFFAKCSGSVELDVLGRVMRVGTLANVTGAGAVNSGKYFVWSVRHAIRADAYTMSFVLVRNAVGEAPSGGSSAGGSVQ